MNNKYQDQVWRTAGINLKQQDRSTTLLHIQTTVAFENANNGIEGVLIKHFKVEFRNQQGRFSLCLKSYLMVSAG